MSKGVKIKSLDLHGLTPDEALGLVDKFLMASHDSKATRIKIMTGKGKGIIRKEVTSYLKKAGYHWQFEKTASGAANEGVLIVFLD